MDTDDSFPLQNLPRMLMMQFCFWMVFKLLSVLKIFAGEKLQFYHGSLNLD